MNALPRRASVAMGFAVSVLHAGASPAASPAPAALPAPAPPPAEAAPFTPYVDRGMTLGPRFAYATLSLSGSLPPDTPGTFGMNVGGGVGFTERLSVDGSLGSIQLAPKIRYESPQLGLLYGLVDTPPFELDVTAHVIFGPERGVVVAQVEPGVIALFRCVHAARLDTGVYLPVSTGDAPTVGLRVPASFAVQLGDNLYVAFNSGATFDDVRRPAATAAVPLGLSAGLSAPVGSGGTVGVTPSVSWPSSLKPWLPEPVQPGPVIVGVTMSVASPF